MTVEKLGYDRSRPLPSFQLLYHYDLVNCPGKMALGLLIKFPPNGSAPPHHHGGASVIGYVVDGTALNKMNDDPVKTHQQGDSWYEAPGCHHKLSDNKSKTEPMTLLATFVIDKKVVEEKGYSVLYQVDEEFSDLAMSARLLFAAFT